MKLKLEVEQGIAILSITETVASQDILVMRAGLSKLFQSGKKSVLLDLTQMSRSSATEAILHELMTVPGWANGSDAQVIIASSVAGFGQAQSRQQGVQLFNSSGAKLLASEAKLASQLRALQDQKSAAEQNLGSRGSLDADVRSLKRENAELKQLIKNLEKQIKQLLKSRTEPFESAITRPQTDAIHKTIANVLKQEGLIPFV